MRFGKYVPILATAGLVVLLQVSLSAAGATYYMTQIIMSAYYALVVIGLCLLMGYAGQVSLGHAGFFAIGGYTSAVLTTCNLIGHRGRGLVGWLDSAGLMVERQDLYGNAMLSFSPWVGCVAGLLAAGIIALSIGLPVIRLKGHYLAMATLGFGVIIYRIVLGAEVFGQADGISNVPPFGLFDGLEVNGRAAFRVENYYIAWAVVLGGMVLAINLVHSRIGRALRSIHQDEEAAHSLGVNTYRYKVCTFVFQRDTGSRGRRPADSLQREHRPVGGHRPQVGAIRGYRGGRRHGQPVGSAVHGGPAELSFDAGRLRHLRRRRVRGHSHRHDVVRAGWVAQTARAASDIVPAFQESA